MDLPCRWYSLCRIPIAEYGTESRLSGNEHGRNRPNNSILRSIGFSGEFWRSPNVTWRNNMKKRMTRIVAGIVACSGTLFFGLILQSAVAQDTASLPYMNPSLSPEQRAVDLVHRMTLAEKASQMLNRSAAVPRLNIPAYQWWSEALHGVIDQGVTEYPEPIGLASTFDAPNIHIMATQIGIEGRIKQVQDARTGRMGFIGGGLDFWSPNINTFRDPRWGRGQETYGEDPYLTSRMAVAFIKGLQGDDPHYFKVIATAKHYAVHSGPEPSRHQFDVKPSERDLNETYLPAFRASVVEGKADSVMCAYNRVDGVPACASTDLLQKRLKGDWGFQGYIVSDCGAISDIFRGHKYKATAAEASAVAVKAGTDLTCGTEYRSLVE